MGRVRGASVVGVMFLGSMACVDLDRFSASKGEGGHEGPEACAGAAVCLSGPPPGWSGPVALVDGDADGCGGNFPTEVFRGDAVLDVPALTCSCECDVPSQTCPAPLFQNYDSIDCTPPTAGSSLTLGQCTSFSPSPPPGGSVRVDGGTATGGSCEAIVGEMRPAISAERRIACGGAPSTAGDCPEGDSCVPVPGGDLAPRLCIWAEGELPCPSNAGFAPAGIVYRGGYQDARVCSACTCGEPTDGTCEGTSEVYGFSQCAGSLKAALSHDGTCVVLVPAGFSSVRLEPSTVVPGACTPAEVAPEGEVERTDPVTVCCTPSL